MDVDATPKQKFGHHFQVPQGYFDTLPSKIATQRNLQDRVGGKPFRFNPWPWAAAAGIVLVGLLAITYTQRAKYDPLASFQSVPINVNDIPKEDAEAYLLLMGISETDVFDVLQVTNERSFAPQVPDALDYEIGWEELHSYL